MKVVILAGGFGSRITEESVFKPKPMIEIGDMPMLWHIMKNYSTYGYNEFIICAGYKQNVIKEWFANYFLHTSDITFDFSNGNEMIVHNQRTESWKVTIVDTGLNTMTGGRVKRIQKYIGNETFMLTYGDGIGDLDINHIVEEHKKNGTVGTISTYNFSQNKGILEIDKDNNIKDLREKSDVDGNLINIGFMVLEPKVFDYISGDESSLEKEALHELAKSGQLKSCLHKGFWQCVDTLREKQYMEQLWQSHEAPWVIWK